MARNALRRKPGGAAILETQSELPLRALEDFIGFELRRAYNASARKFVEIMTDLSLKPGQYSLMLAIERVPGSTQSTVARLLSVDRSTMVPLLNQLERKGYVQRVRRADDRRAYALQLTPVGSGILHKSRELIELHERTITRGFSASDRASLLAGLRRIGQNAA
jgi:DNA-binding MarR family transcriptional regulator